MVGCNANVHSLNSFVGCSKHSIQPQLQMQAEVKGAGKSAPHRQLRQTRSRTARHTDSTVKAAVEVSHPSDEEDVDIEHSSEIDIMDSSAILRNTSSSPDVSNNTSRSPAVSLDIMSSPTAAKNTTDSSATSTDNSGSNVSVDVLDSPVSLKQTKRSPTRSQDKRVSPAVSVDIMSSPAVPETSPDVSVGAPKVPQDPIVLKELPTTSPVSVDILNSPALLRDNKDSAAVPVCSAVLHPPLPVEHAQDVSLSRSTSLMHDCSR